MALTRAQKIAFKKARMKMAGRAMRSFGRFLADEARRGSFFRNATGVLSGAVEDMSWAELLEERARRSPKKKFLLYGDESFTYREMDENANRCAHLLLSLGGGRGKGIGIFMRNSPRFLDLFFGAQKIGMYIVPINPELRGDGLNYILDHSDVEFLACDAELLDTFGSIPARPARLKTLIVDDIEKEACGIALPEGAVALSRFRAKSAANPKIGYDPKDMVLLIYTSGTTGRPKGVVYTYNRSRVKLLGLMGGILVNPDDVYYTALALCHGNALFLTVTLAMSVGATVALARKFSASRFWDDIRRYDVTIFNTIGSIVPILMKQPECALDLNHKVTRVLSAACPADMWEAFEKRFGVKIFEGYGAVDSGGKGILNLGTAPVGSLGKALGAPGSCRVVDENGVDVPPNTPGQLIFKVGDKKSSVRYYKNEEATEKKVHGGWMYTGDIVRRDEDGYLYFVGRDTESMRKSGENVSAYEVEHVIVQHPEVEDAAVYAVPSELAEDEIMAAVKLMPGSTLSAPALRAWLADKLARYAVPRYIRFVTEFPMTQTHRIIKKELEKAGVTPDTYDANTERN